MIWLLMLILVFFGGKPASCGEVVHAVRGAMSVNAVGNEVVGLLVERGVVSAAGVKVVDGLRLRMFTWFRDR